jgi:hypothetical protein
VKIAHRHKGGTQEYRLYGPQADSYLLSLYVLERIFKRACVEIESVEGKAADIFANIRL